jgi:DNA helicase-2/ATP-dependent DNA helicase PcrA
MKKYILHDNAREIETHIDFRGNLNDQQYEVVTRAEGPCLVLAGAGSGKTRTLIYRLAYLLERGVPPENILLMTFTNKAAREMQDRAEILLKYKPKNLWSGTFHHIGNRCLRMFAPSLGYGRDFGILDQLDSRDLIKACMKKAGAGGGKSAEERFPKPSVVQSIISMSANTCTPVEKVLEAKYPYFSKFSREISAIQKTYNFKKKESNTMDYDDLLSKWKWLLENVPEARAKFSNQFKYIMVDEYQDTNVLQAEVIDILGAAHRNVLVVGDDAQAIYSFRGACVENILNFPKRFQDAKIFKLEINYRSTPDILGLANDSLKNNLNQFFKELRAVNPPLEKPALVEVKDLYAQAGFVAQRVLELREEGIEMSKIAVLFRAHYQSAELEMELVKRGIPYIVRGGMRFFEQAHIKDVLSYLKIVMNPLDEIAWIRTLTLCPGIGPGYAERIFDAYRRSGIPLSAFLGGDFAKSLPRKVQMGFVSFVKVMRTIAVEEEKQVPAEMISAVMDSGYETHIMANYDNAKDRVDDIKELVNFSHDYKSLASFLSDITLRESFKGETVTGAEEEDEELVLSTIHQAKGLEWDVVMVIGLCEGQFPHPKAMGESGELEEERRLFYVSVTRAKKYLYMVHPVTRFDYKMGTVVARRSRFLEELDVKDYEVWDVDSSAMLEDFSEDRPRGKNSFPGAEYEDGHDGDTVIEL